MRPILLLGAGLLVSTSASAQLTVTATTPLLHAGNQAPNTAIVVDFDRAVDATTLDEFRVWGSTSGPVRGVFALELGGARVRFTPLRTFGAGEVVQFSLSNTLRAADGSFLRAQGYASSFRIVAAPANMVFTPIASWDPDPTTFARIYGAQTCDFNGDEYVDLALVCENTSDVRVFLNDADASGGFGSLAGAPYATGAWPSPNETGDVDGDGLVDIVTCNTQGDSFTVLLGNGNGTFQRAPTYAMGPGPHGIALLDVDGDGDLDVATANTGSNNLSLRRNNGDGTFGPMVFLPSVLDGTFALAAADMNNDNIVDLVVGARFSTNVCVHLSNGDGTFAPQTPVSTGGQTWMIACGDVDGDRNMDVSSANGPTGNGAILRGNGAGGLFPAVVTPGAGWMTATDLGDLDGDGDLDWVLSSFGGGRWTIYRNNGLGAMSLQQTIFATDSPACATLFDIDRDGDLDLALLDELADLCTIYENGVLDAVTFCSGDGSGAACPCANSGANGHGCAHSTPTGGALLNAQGRASVAADAFSLAVSGLPATTTALLFQGAGELGGGAGAPFKAGVKCVRSPTLRLGLKSAVNGYCVWGATVGDAPLSISGGIAPAGGLAHYQVWFRDPASSCTNSGANLSNGVRVTWTP
jgi:hypothetical protein